MGTIDASVEFEREREILHIKEKEHTKDEYDEYRHEDPHNPNKMMGGLTVDVDKDLTRTLKTEKVSYQNPINEFLELVHMRWKQLNETMNNQDENAEIEPSKRPFVHVILGNRAGDLDSIVSTVGFAYLQYCLEPEELYIPLANIKRSRLALRTEVAYLLKKRKIREDLLIFREELNLRTLHEKGMLKLILVDHNTLDPNDAYLGDSVVKVYDHHNNENKYPHAEARIIEPVGSCASLITREIFQYCPRIMDRNLARILLAPIVIDTSNFDLGLARPLMSIDEQMAAALLDVIEPQKYPKLQYRSQYFSKLVNAKYDTSQLTTEDLLRRDYKEWITNNIRYGISAVTLSIEKWAERDGELKSHFLQRMRAKKLNLLVIMLVTYDSILSRELILFTDHKDLGESLAHFLMQSELKLSFLRGTGSLPLDEIEGSQQESEEGLGQQDQPQAIGLGKENKGEEKIEQENEKAGESQPQSESEQSKQEASNMKKNEKDRKSLDNSGQVQMNNEDGMVLFAFNQGDSSFSRKLIQPLIHSILLKLHK